MPKGHYDRAISQSSHQEVICYLLRHGPLPAGKVLDRLRSRVAARRSGYALLRAMERDGTITSAISQTGEFVYSHNREKRGHHA